MAQSSKKKTGSKKPQATTKKNASSAKRRRTTKKAQRSSGIGREILVLICIVCAIMLFLGNIGVAGPVGDMLSRLQLGLFGMAGYFFPVFFCGAALYGAAKAKDYPLYTAGRLLLLLLMLVAFCAGMELAVTGLITPEMNTSYFYKEGTTGIGGGFFGGCLVLLLLPLLGKIGSYVVLLAFLLIGVILVTGRGILFPLKDKGEKVVRAVREESGRRSEELAAKRLEKERQRELAEKERLEREKKQTLKESARTRKAAGLSPGEAVIEPEPAYEAEQYGESVSSFVTESVFEPVNDFEAVPSPAPEYPREKKPARESASASGQRAQSEPEKHSSKDPLKLSNSVDFLFVPDPDEYAAQAAYVSEPETLDVPDLRVGASVAFDTQNLHVDDSAIFDTQDFRTDNPAAFDVQDLRVDNPVIFDAANLRTDYPEPDAPDAPAFEDNASDERMTDFERESSFEQPPAAMQPEPGISGPEAAFLERMGGNVSRETAGAAVSAQPPVVKEYKAPSINLLNRPRFSRGMRDGDIRKIAAKLEATLNDFGVRVRVTDYSCGPSVTRYELHPEQGVKVSRIVALADDIKLNLAATDIRIEAPIPGKSAVGIEVPNPENRTVFLRELLESEEYRRFPSKVAFAVGQDIAGKTIVADLARMPHLLIAGSTGSGKSVCINTLIMSILYKAKPDEVGLIMVDPKVVELSAYNGIPHLLIPVVTDPKKAAGALNWAVAEMTRRYKQFSDYNVRDIRGYNQKIKDEEYASEADKPQPMKQIVIIVDELADLMMVAPGEVEESICRLAQLARAAGIHLVLATQRPSVNVITGLIKANVPSRIAFATSSGIDSRTIIDMNGAEKLLGKGDMLFYPTGYPKPVRVQGAFVSDEEVAAVTDFLKEQTSEEATAAGVALAGQIGGAQPAGERENEGPARDELFVKAAEFIIDKEKASIGNLQRVFRIGFNRAARIMDQLSDEGIVGPEEGTKPRQILMTMQQFEQWKKDNNLA